MLDLWLRRKLNDTWEDVVSALQQMGENRVAESIRQKYIRGRSEFSRLYSALARWFTTDSGPRSSEFRFARQYRSLRHNSNNKTQLSLCSQPLDKITLKKWFRRSGLAEALGQCSITLIKFIYSMNAYPMHWNLNLLPYIVRGQLPCWYKRAVTK